MLKCLQKKNAVTDKDPPLGIARRRDPPGTPFGIPGTPGIAPGRPGDLPGSNWNPLGSAKDSGDPTGPPAKLDRFLIQPLWAPWARNGQRLHGRAIRAPWALIGRALMDWALTYPPLPVLPGP